MRSERAQVEKSMRDSGRAQVRKKNRYKIECFYGISSKLNFGAHFGSHVLENQLVFIEYLFNFYELFFLAKSIFRSVLDDFLIKIGSIWKLPGCQFWGNFSLNFICFMCICSFYHKSENRGCQRGATNRYFLPPQSCRGQLISQPKGRGMISRIARAQVAHSLRIDRLRFPGSGSRFHGFSWMLEVVWFLFRQFSLVLEAF